MTDLPFLRCHLRVCHNEREANPRGQWTDEPSRLLFRVRNAGEYILGPENRRQVEQIARHL